MQILQSFVVVSDYYAEMLLNLMHLKHHEQRCDYLDDDENLIEYRYLKINFFLYYEYIFIYPVNVVA